MQGPTNRKYGKLTIRFNGYGVTKTSTAPSNYTMISEPRMSGVTDNAAVAHEDDFSRSAKSIVVHDIKAEVRTLQSYHQTRPKPGEVWYAISTKWIQQWLVGCAFVDIIPELGDLTYTSGAAAVCLQTQG